ncbi:pheromone A receptor-domain-containing protein [Rostrohypoxylon terebratum]|nr:pheromone A receptor-domain-containing protein [Rostrohypoxylon terebratum]
MHPVLAFIIQVVIIIIVFFAKTVMGAPIEAEVSSTVNSNDLRFAPNAGLTVNLSFRVILSIIGTVFCWVPFRLLWRNGDFAAVVLIIDVALMNLFTVLNSLIWNSDNWDKWWLGTGLCDVEVYLWMPLQTIYAGAILAIIRQLAYQVKLTRASQLSRSERKVRAIQQAAIIFPFAGFQLVFTWFDLAQRYNIGTLIGCIASYDNSWPRFIVYDTPPTVFVMACVPYAFLTAWRYRTISRSTLQVLRTNEAAVARATWIRNRLYAMSVAILIVYLPVSLYLAVINFQELENAHSYSYVEIHWGKKPYPWDAILFVPSWLLSTLEMNQPWIAISTTIVIVGFFGTTKDALVMYRQYAMALGLQRIPLLFSSLLFSLSSMLSFRRRLRNDPDAHFQSDNHPEQADGSWIELINQPARRRDSRPRPEPINTDRVLHHMDAYFQNSGETTAAEKPTGQTPLLSLPLPPRCETSSPEPLPALYSTPTKALDKETVTTMIPPRSSSLAYQPPASAPATATWAPLPRAPTDFSLSLRHRDRDKAPRYPRQPMPCAHPSRLRSDSAPVESDSPLSSLYTHRAVQLSSVLETPSFHRASSFYGSGVLTSSTASALQAQDVANMSAATSVARSDEEGYVRVVIGPTNPLLRSPRHSHSQTQTHSDHQPSTPTPPSPSPSPPPLPPRSLARLSHADVGSPRRAYQMGALRGRDQSAPRTVSEVEAQGIKAADEYDESNYSDA